MRSPLNNTKLKHAFHALATNTFSFVCKFVWFFSFYKIIRPFAWFESWCAWSEMHISGYWTRAYSFNSCQFFFFRNFMPIGWSANLTFINIFFSLFSVCLFHSSKFKSLKSAITSNCCQFYLSSFLSLSLLRSLHIKRCFNLHKI